MAVTRRCEKDADLVEIDVRAGQFLRYEVRFRGALPKFVVNDETGRIILDENAEARDGALAGEWPPADGWVWDGADVLAFSGIMMLVERYDLKVAHCSESGRTIRVVRDCRFEKERDSDLAFDLLDVFVTPEET